MSSDSLTVHTICQGLDLPDWVLDFRDSAGDKVIFGPGRLADLGLEVSLLEGTHALLVTDPGIANAGLADKAFDSLRRHGIACSTFAEVRENPTTEDVERCAAFAEAEGIDLIIGLGGGSSLDTAKGCNFLLTNGGRMQDYWGIGKATRRMLPFIAVPTTAGTGSECQSFALISDAKTHAKMACGDPKCAAATTILDPELTITMPHSVTAHTGIDAIAHALESAVCTKRNDISLAYSYAAWRLLDSGFPIVNESPSDLEARSAMQIGAAFAGVAIENSMIGIAHSCANPLTAHYNIVHGLAVGVMLPHVIEFNQSDAAAGATYRLFSSHIPLADRVREHLRLCGMDQSLRELGVERSQIPLLAAEAAKQWTAQFNPIPVDAAALEKVYQAAW